MNLRLYVALGWKPEYTIQSRVIQLPWSKWGFSTGTVQLVGREVQLELPAKKFTYATELESLWINVRKSWQKGNKVLELTLFEAYLNYIFLDRSEQKWKNNRLNRHWLPMLPFAPCPATLPSQPSPSSTWTWLPVPQRFRSDRSSSTETLKVSSNVKRWKRKGGIKVEGLCIQTR